MLVLNRGMVLQVWKRGIVPPIRCLNRVLFEPEEVRRGGGSVDSKGRETQRVILKNSDKRAKHIREVLKIDGVSQNKEIRVGVVGGSVGYARVNPEVSPQQNRRHKLGDEESNDDLVLDMCLPNLPDSEQNKAALLQTPLPPPPRISVLLAAPRPKRMRALLPIFSQLGVHSLHITNAARVEKSFLSGGVLSRSEVVRELLIEGLAQQAVDTHLPEVTVHKQLKPFVQDHLGSQCTKYKHKLLLHPPSTNLLHDSLEIGSLETCSLKAEEGRAGEKTNDVLLAIGPEGGWVDFELDLFRQAGFKCMHMGPRILRTDVAVVAAISLVRAALFR